jgi:hypothetical protein
LATVAFSIDWGAAGCDLTGAIDDSAAFVSAIVKRFLHFAQVAGLPTAFDGTLYFDWQCEHRVRIGTAETQDAPEVR